MRSKILNASPSPHPRSILLKYGGRPPFPHSSGVGLVPNDPKLHSCGSSSLETQNNSNSSGNARQKAAIRDGQRRARYFSVISLTGRLLELRRKRRDDARTAPETTARTVLWHEQPGSEGEGQPCCCSVLLLHHRLGSERLGCSTERLAERASGRLGPPRVAGFVRALVVELRWFCLRCGLIGSTHL